MQRNTTALAVASAFLAMGLGSQAHASAFALHEQGISGLGNAYAGAAAVAEDATTVWWNPAGMSRLPAGKHFALGAAYIMPSTEFNNRASVPASLSNPALNGNGGDASDPALVPSFFFAMDAAPRWNVGLGVSVPFGLSTKYDPNWIGRFQGIESEVQTININPAVSFKLSDRASIGGGISYQYGKVDLLSAVNYSAAAFSAGGAGALTAVGGAGVEGQNKTSVDGSAWGFNFGALFDVLPATRVGVHYRSVLDYKLEGDTTFSNRPALLAAGLPDGNVKLELQTPDSVAFSAVHELSPQWQLLADATWTHWSRIRQLPLVRTSGTQSGQALDTLTFNFNDVWRFSAGANYRVSQAIVLKVGIAHDKSPVPNADTRSVRLPDNDRTWYSVGAAFKVSRSGKLDVGYTFVDAKDADINNTQAGKGTVNGTYDAKVHVFGLQYQQTF
ncbi:MAG TPA: outer membrane protein transport protein [Burkholderiales bacterium]|nr:outer membrane protein transport protein [Burkholderiales bacterium]